MQVATMLVRRLTEASCNTYDEIWDLFNLICENQQEEDTRVLESELYDLLAADLASCLG